MNPFKKNKLSKPYGPAQQPAYIHPGRSFASMDALRKVHPLVWVIAAAAILLIVLVVLIVKLSTPTAQAPATVTGTAAPTATAQPLQADRSGKLAQPSAQAPAATARYIGFGAQDFNFAEKQINLPAIYDTEIVFSAGTGSISGPVLSKLYYYNLDTGEEKLLSTSKIYQGEYYETLISPDWIVWLETDHGKNNKIYTMKRSTGAVSLVKNCSNGKPKLRLYNDILIWMEQVEDSLDELYMFDLESQENLSLFEIKDVSTYGVSAPCIYQDTIVWSGPDTAQTAEDKTANGDKSSIYWLPLGEEAVTGETLNSHTYSPGTYVHEPLYNGEYFVWIDGNKSPNAKLYIGKDGEEPVVIDQGVTTYSIGNGIVVYGRDQSVWCYVISTGEICRLTHEGEKGMLPLVHNRTVVWYNLSADSEKDMLRYIVLDEEEIYPQWPVK